MYLTDLCTQYTVYKRDLKKKKKKKKSKLYIAGVKRDSETMLRN